MMVDFQQDTDNKALIKAVKSLKMKFPVAAISKKTEYSKGNVSKYLNGKLKPSSAFLEKFQECFNINLANFQDDQTPDDFEVNEPKEQLPNKAGNVTETLSNGRFRLWTKKLPIKAFASYLSEFRNANFIEELEDVSWIVDHVPRGRYMTIESEGDSMNGGGIYDTPDRADMLGRELQKHHWKDGFRESIYGWVIVHEETVVFKDIKSFNKKTGDIVCSSRSGLPQHPDFTINLNNVREIWKVIKRQF